MDKALKRVRTWMRDSNIDDFNRAITKAKLTDLEADILRRRFVRGHTNLQVATDLYISESYVTKILARAYKRIGLII